MYAGSRNFWKAPDSPCVWRKALRDNPEIQEWCEAHEGHVLYTEVTPTQKGYRYGCDEGKTRVFVFDIRMPGGEYLPKSVTLLSSITDTLTKVPVIYQGPFEAEGPWPASFYEGPSLVDPKIQREGVVITVTDPARWERGIGRIQLKRVSNAFLEKDNR